MLQLKSLRGLWRRALLARPGEVPDRTTEVLWLQGRSLYVDLRQPRPRPSFAAVRSLQELEPHHIAWMARQEGFAGTLSLDGDAAEWRRDIDFQPSSGLRDRGRVRLQGDVLEEHGIEADYLEEWRRDSLALTPCTGVALRNTQGAAAYLVRVAQDFAFARPRKMSLPTGGTLTRHVRAAPRQETLALLDFEISFGRVESGAWRISRSSLPFKEGSRFAFDVAGETLRLAGDGGTWSIAATDYGIGAEGRLAQVVQALSEK